MKIKIICVGNIKEEFYRNAIDEYTKRLQKFCKLELIEVKQSKIDDEQSKSQEYEKIIPYLEGYVISLAIEGQQFNSLEFANKIKNFGNVGNSTISFVIGGSFGIDDRIKQKSNLLLSFSKMTFPHQLFRVMLLEQIYRAFSILNNTPYHK